MKMDSIWRLLARKMSGEATKEELNALQELLKDDPEMNYIAETFSRLWNSLPDQKKGQNTARDL
jgi:hypothetical protein